MSLTMNLLYLNDKKIIGRIFFLIHNFFFFLSDYGTIVCISPFPFPIHFLHRKSFTILVSRELHRDHNDFTARVASTFYISQCRPLLINHTWFYLLYIKIFLLKFSYWLIMPDSTACIMLTSGSSSFIALSSVIPYWRH